MKRWTKYPFELERRMVREALLSLQKKLEEI
jgi:hypothetical protein